MKMTVVNNVSSRNDICQGCSTETFGGVPSLFVLIFVRKLKIACLLLI